MSLLIVGYYAVGAAVGWWAGCCEYGDWRRTLGSIYGEANMPPWQEGMKFFFVAAAIVVFFWPLWVPVNFVLNFFTGLPREPYLNPIQERRRMALVCLQRMSESKRS